MKPYGIIYCITNIINGKRYIGQTIQNIKRRWKEHLLNVKRNRETYLYNSIKKYGKENFVIEHICDCSNIEELNASEEYYILVYDTIADNGKGYNLTYGGDNKRC